MNFQFHKAEGEYGLEPDQGVLKVDAPHWAAEVRVANSQLEPVLATGVIRHDSSSGTGYLMEATLPAGIYEVSVTLEGKTRREWVPISGGEVTHVDGDAWESLSFTSASPVRGTNNFDQIQAERAARFSVERTDLSTQGNSGLFLFVRKDKRSAGTASFFDGLQLLTPADELVTDFSRGFEFNEEEGWMAFNADLPTGGYILRRGRKGVRLRYQAFYLCRGWRTHIFLNAGAFPSLSTWSLNMARTSVPFDPGNPALRAGEVIIDGLRYTTDSAVVLQNPEVERSLKVLLDNKFDNPWLGVLGAHAILKLEKSTRDLKTQAEYGDSDFRTRVSDEIEKNRWYSTVLREKVRPFLAAELPDHPDVRSLLLDEDRPADRPFDFPPSLLPGLRRIQEHSLVWADTIRVNSLSDRILDNLLTNSPWVGWRSLDRDTGATGAQRKARLRTRKDMMTDYTVSSVLSPTVVPRTPVFHLQEFDPKASKKSATETVLQDAPIIQKSKELVLRYVQSLDMETLPSEVTINSSDEIEKTLSDVSAANVSRSFGIPLARTEETLRGLKEQAAGPSGTSAVSAKPEKSVNLSIQQAILEYALSSPISSDTEQAPPVSKYMIREIVGKIQGEADRLLTQLSDGKDLSREGNAEFAERLYCIADDLLKHADFVLITDHAERIQYSNGTFVLLISPKSSDRTSQKTNFVTGYRLKRIREWQKALKGSPKGISSVHNAYLEEEWQRWRLSRTEITDEALNRSMCCLNVLRVDGYRHLDDSDLDRVSELTARFSMFVPLWLYGSAEHESEYRSKIERTIQQLEEEKVKWRQTMEKNNETVSDDIAGVASGSTLYATEFFNVERHDLITGVARTFFSPKTAQSVQGFFAQVGATFDDSGGWADRIKTQNPPNDTETRAFLEDDRNNGHRQWHYVNLPLGSESYSHAGEFGFTRENDVVRMAQECVEVLQGNSDRFSMLNALRLIGHLVGDIHQPLHIGCGFIDTTSSPPSFATDPEAIRDNDLDSDTGGNRISLPGAGKMHSYWDSGLGGAVSLDAGVSSDGLDPQGDEMRQAAFEKLRRLVQQDIASAPLNAQSDDPGPLTDRIEQWANDSLIAAREAYRTLEIQSVQGNSFKVSWEGKTKYNERCAPILKRQMTDGARHLAELLNAIFDPSES